MNRNSYKSVGNSRYVLILLSLVVAFILTGFFGIDDREAIALYLTKLQTLSEHKLSVEQLEYVSNFYVNNKNRHPKKFEREKVRKIFNKKRSMLRRTWEHKYNLTWPKLIITQRGVTRAHNFEAHHIVPINAGGINIWWNLTPLSKTNHKLLHQSMEEHACFSHNIIQLKCLRFALAIKNLTISLMNNKNLKFKAYQLGW